MIYITTDGVYINIAKICMIDQDRVHFGDNLVYQADPVMIDIDKIKELLVEWGRLEVKE